MASNDRARFIEGDPMESKTRSYSAGHIDVLYDVKRCIHAEECVSRLRAVFDNQKRPWIQPEGASAEQIAATVEHCPSGALHHQRKDGGPAEAPDESPQMRLVENGPIYLRGRLYLLNAAKEVVREETRLALCRCGASRNKPFCDNSHKDIDFKAPGGLINPREPEEIGGTGSLSIRPTLNGPNHLTGDIEIRDAAGTVLWRGSGEWFCRCGGSKNKPFCDGTHKVNGLQAETL